RLHSLFAKADGAAGDQATQGRKPEPIEDIFHLKPLPQARTEGEQIAAVLRATPYLGKAAEKECLQESQAPVVLHLAVPAYCPSELPQEPEREGRPEAGAAPALPFPHPRWQNPLRRTGLALAGAPRTLPTPGNDRGLLTAYDVAALDLTGTELVVLSA